MTVNRVVVLLDVDNTLLDYDLQALLDACNAAQPGVGDQPKLVVV